MSENNSGNFQFSIAFQSDKTPAQYEELAELVDRYNFEVVSVYNDLLFQPALPALILMARKLRQARLGPAALNPYTMHPLEIAGQIAALDAISEGRAYLGLVRGSWLDQLGIESVRPLQTLREAALLVNHLLAGKEEAFEGQIFKLAAGSKLNYRPYRSHIPLMVGTWGSQTARMAGELAEEVKIGGSANPAMVGHLRTFLAEGSRKAGRAEDAVGIVLGAVCVVDEDREAARAKIRREMALYLPVVAPLDPTLTDKEWLAQLEEAARRQDYQYISDHLISDELMDKFAFAGNPADIIGQTEKLIEAGANRVEYGTPHGLQSAEGIRLLGEKVLPHFK
jgi:5,10-methylenetetrahydromethanopterin reductase